MLAQAQRRLTQRSPYHEIIQTTAISITATTVEFCCRSNTNTVSKRQQPTYTNDIQCRSLVTTTSTPTCDNTTTTTPPPPDGTSILRCNTFIIGAGPIGSSVAYHLAATCRDNDGSDIVIVERDPTGNSSPAVRSAGGIRQQFSLKENVQMSLYGYNFIKQSNQLLSTKDNNNYPCNVNFMEHGYLFLASSLSGRHQLLHNNRVQHEAGATDIVLLERDQLQQRFPWLNCDDIELGSFGEQGEGWFDPWSFLGGLKRKNQEMGVRYLHGDVIGSQRDTDTGRVLSMDLQLKHDDVHSQHRVTADFVVNAAGAHCADALLLLVGDKTTLTYPLPVRPRKRSIFYFHCNHPDSPSIVPLTIDPGTGVYVRSEGHQHSNTFLCGVSPQRGIDDPDCIDAAMIEHADHYLFEEIIWPALYHRVPAFGELKLLSSWAGLYEYNIIDQNAIIDFHPEIPNVLCVNGFSGHGLQHSPAVGRAAAELLDCKGQFQTLDLNIFRYDRCMGFAEPVMEVGIV